MRFKRRRRARGPSKRRALEWIGFNSVNAGTGSPAAHVNIPIGGIYGNYILSPDELTTLYDEPTLLRSILRFSAATTNAAVANGTDWFFGWGLVALDFEAPGGTLPAAVLPYVPLPFFDSDTDWIYEYHQTVVSGQQTLKPALDATVNGAGEVDIRTRRRFPNGHGLALIAYFDCNTVNMQINVNFAGRLLFANH